MGIHFKMDKIHDYSLSNPTLFESTLETGADPEFSKSGGSELFLGGSPNISLNLGVKRMMVVLTVTSNKRGFGPTPKNKLRIK